MAGGSFIERDESGQSAYLAEEVAEGLTREELIEGMERLLGFTKEATYKWENNYFALIYATVARSARTYRGVCMLLKAGLAVQAAMLARTLFEDVIVAHWMVFNHKDPDWLVERFLRHREAVALHQRKMQQETTWAMGPPISAPVDLEDQAEELREEFGREAQRDWWDPGRQGKGQGKDVGMRKIVSRLEKAAEEHKMFHPRFAGGEEPILKRMDLVIHKWLNQCIHHTVIGLPFAPATEDTAELSSDPMVMVGYSASWLFAQQVYLLHELNGRDFKGIDAVWYYCLGAYVKIFLGQESADRLFEQWDQRYGESVDRDMQFSKSRFRRWNRLRRSRQ